MIIQPNVKNFIKSLREVGYNFEVAVADLVDNSISAEATTIKMMSTNEHNEFSFYILDNGIGMNNYELIEAMRLGSKDPDEERNDKDLGRFGLGLKTASFSQCKKLTVISKKDDEINGLQWDLDVVVERNDWYIKLLTRDEIDEIDFISELYKLESGTFVIWEKVDGIDMNFYVDTLFTLKKHLELVFHRYLEGEYPKTEIYLNNLLMEPFNPFALNSTFTQKLETERFKVSKYDKDFIAVSPYILPYHSKVSLYEYEKLATHEGFNKTQGFYLYRNGRLLVYGTWWGLAKTSEAFKLIRIKIDINNSQDALWNIDVMKSTAQPSQLIKKELKRILASVLDKGKNMHGKRGRIDKYDSEKFVPLWYLKDHDEKISFIVNREHPLYILNKEMSSSYNIFENYIKSLETYLPVDSIYSQLINEPKRVNQSSLLVREDLAEFKESIKNLEISDEFIKPLLESGIFNYEGENKNESN